MELRLFDIRNVSDSKSYILANCNLYNYLSELSPEAFNFEVQRRIVENKYLDTIAESVKNGIPFPAITLTCDRNPSSFQNNILDVSKCEILDGLQRTYRLWILYIIHKLITDHPTCDYNEIHKIIIEHRDYKDFVVPSIIKRSTLRNLMDNQNAELSAVIESFKRYEITLNIWFGLNNEDIIRQMLILNAGHKRVSNTHQFEIVYLHYFKNHLLNIDNNIRILREKDHDYKKISSKDRLVGMYSLSSVMIAFQSYYYTIPQRIKRVNQIVLDLDNSDVFTQYSELLIGSTLSDFINRLYILDKKLSKTPESSYWFAKDTTLSGVFAAIGARTSSDTTYNDFSMLDTFISTVRTEDLALNDYQLAYDNLSSTRINVGAKVRKAIYIAFRDYEPGKKIDWFNAFLQA